MNKIKELRKKRGLTQNKFCEFLQIAQPTLSGYETNNFEPDFEMAFKIADYFDVSVDYLLGRDVYNEKKPVGFPTDSNALNKDLKMIGFTSEDYDTLSDPEKQALLTTIKSIAASFKKSKQ